MKNLNITIKTALSTILLVFSFSILKAQEMNFTGNWNRNSEKCLASGLSITSIPLEIQVKQTPSSFEITRAAKDKEQKGYTYTEVLKFDGTTSQPVVVRQNLNKKSTIQWSADHKSLIVQSEYIDDQGNHLKKMTETITVSADGKTLQFNSTLDDCHVYNLIEVFDRKD